MQYNLYSAPEKRLELYRIGIRISKKMIPKRKLAAVVLTLCASLIAAFGPFYYLAVPSVLSEDLIRGVHVNDATPELILKRVIDPLDLEVTDIMIDSEPADPAIFKDRGYYKLRLTEPLANGRHILSYTVAYAPLGQRQMHVVTDLTVDTQAPEISIYGNTGQLISKEPIERVIWGRTEEGSQLKIKYGNQDTLSPEIDSNGHFRVSYMPTSGSELWIEAEDLAGNLNDRSFRVVLDTERPSFKALNFASGRSYFDPEFVPELSVADGISDLESVAVFVNGKLSGTNANVKEAVFRTNDIARGPNIIEAVAYDGAGNLERASYTFDVYRTKIMIDLAKRDLVLYEGSKLVKRYKISIGMEGYNTPRGSFKVIKKAKRPTWYNPNAEWSKDMPPTIPAGPGSPLGTRALYLNVPNIRIHGTYANSSIGTAASHGCIRMLIKDSEELYELVPVGTPTIIS